MLQGNVLYGIGTMFEVVDGEQKPAPHETGSWRGQTGFAEAVFQRASPDPALFRDLLHAERLLGMLEAEAEDRLPIA